MTGIFGSSMETLISVHGEAPATRELVHCGSAYATVVSVDRDGGPVPIPFYLTPATAVEQRRCQVSLPFEHLMMPLQLVCMFGWSKSTYRQPRYIIPCSGNVLALS